MRVLMSVLHYYPVIGGLETWTQNIAERVSDKVEVFVVAGKVVGQPKFEEKKGVKIFRTSLFSLRDLSYSSPFYILTALPFIFLKSLLVIKKERINLLHCQGFLSSLLGYLLWKFTKVPYITTVQRLEKRRGFLRKLVYKNAKVCIAASSAIKKYFEEIGCKNIEVIPNGIDLEKFQDLDREKSREKLDLKDEFIIITVARLEIRKGIAYLILALPHLISKIPNFKLLIVGEGERREKLAELTKEMKLEDRVKFLGEVPNEEIPQILAAADCFVLPSIQEGFGISILEAQAAKVPVVATNVGGIPDIIENGKNGILVEPKNPKEIAKAIFKVFSHLQLRQSLVNNAMAELSRYNWENIAQKVYQVYQRVI